MVLFLLLILAFFLRLIALNQSLWLDEAISVMTVKNLSLKKIIVQFLLSDFHPPLYYLILSFWVKVFGFSEISVRIPSVLFALGTINFVYQIAKLFGNQKLGKITALFLATSPLHIYYSQEARMYSLATFLTSGSMYYFIKLLKNENTLFTIYYLLFTILMVYSHYLCWLVVFTQVVYFFISKKWTNKKILLNFLVSQFLNFFFYFPWFPILFNQLRIGQRVALRNIIWRKVVGSLSAKAIALLPIKFIIGRTSFSNKNFYIFIVLLVILFFGFLLWQAAKEKQNQLIRLIWFWLIIPVLLGIIISFKIPIFSYFRFLFCLPAFYILIACGIFKFKKPQKFIVLVLLINLFFSLRYLVNQNFHREDWKKAVKILHQKNLNKTPVLILENVTAPFDYYDKGESKVVFFNQKELVTNENTIWLIPYAQPIFDPQDLTRSFLKTKGFQRVYEQHFRGVTLEKWQKILANKV